jgi:hypothetical protein
LFVHVPKERYLFSLIVYHSIEMEFFLFDYMIIIHRKSTKNNFQKTELSWKLKKDCNKVKQLKFDVRKVELKRKKIVNDRHHLFSKKESLFLVKHVGHLPLSVRVMGSSRDHICRHGSFFHPFDYCKQF